MPPQTAHTYAGGRRAGATDSRSRGRRPRDTTANELPEMRRAARQVVYNAVRRGDLVPAACCEECDHDFTEYPRHAHHDDHGLPLDVRWICSRCHHRLHGWADPAPPTLGSSPGATAPQSYTAARAEAIRQFERDYLAALLAGTSGNVSEASRLSGMDRATIYRMLDRHGLTADEFRPLTGGLHG